MSKEQVSRKQELNWPPANTTDLMAFFLEKESSDTAYKGMGDVADDFVRKIMLLLKTPDDDIILYGNKKVDLMLAPEGFPPGPAGEALRFGVYALTQASMTYAHELPSHDRAHAVYEGAYEVIRNNEKRVVPLLFKEEYIREDAGTDSIRWFMRTNFPQREYLETIGFDDDPIEGEARRAWGASVLEGIARIQEVEASTPEDGYRQAA